MKWHLLQDAACHVDIQDTAYDSIGVSQSAHQDPSRQHSVTAAVPFLNGPFRRTDIDKRSFSCTAPGTWNSLPPAVINCE